MNNLNGQSQRSQRPYRKDMYRPIKNRIKQIYSEEDNIGEQIPTYQIIKKKIRKIINTHNDQELKNLIQELPRKFDSKIKRVIDNMAKEILTNQQEKLNEEYNPYQNTNSISKHIK